jgi:hypothetical protein
MKGLPDWMLVRAELRRAAESLLTAAVPAIDPQRMSAERLEVGL